MKKLVSICVLLVLAAGAMTAFGQKPKSKDDLYKDIATLVNNKKPEDTDKAYQLSREFLDRFGKDKDDHVNKIRTFYTNHRKQVFFDAVGANKFAEAFTTGREMLAEQPDYVEVLLSLSYEGYTSFLTTKATTYNDESIGYARRALTLMEAGKLPSQFYPFKTKDESIAFMYYVAGTLEWDKDMKAGAADVYRATIPASMVKSSAEPYSMIASFYEAKYEKLSNELQAKIDAKTISDEDKKAETDKVNKVIDLMMEAYVKTVDVAETSKNPNAAKWKTRLTQIYQFRNKTLDAMPEYIKYVLTMPLSDPAKLTF